MTAQARFKQSDINRAMRGARAAGFTNVSVEISPDGKIVINARDDLTEAAPADDWRRHQPLYKDH
ncbi:MAG: hypothetical protein QM690_17215 [Sphingobium sp.]